MADLLQQLNEAEERCDRLRALAHEAPMNIYHVNHDGHRWVEQNSYAYSSRANEWMQACIVRDMLRAALAEAAR